MLVEPHRLDKPAGYRGPNLAVLPEDIQASVHAALQVHQTSREKATWQVRVRRKANRALPAEFDAMAKEEGGQIASLLFRSQKDSAVYEISAAPLLSNGICLISDTTRKELAKALGFNIDTWDKIAAETLKKSAVGDSSRSNCKVYGLSSTKSIGCDDLTTITGPAPDSFSS